MKANVKSKQQQLYSKYSSHVGYYNTWQNAYQAHDLYLKPISYSVAVSIPETASQLTDELPV